MVNKINNENFDEEVLQSEKPVLIDFYADWCGPCKMSAPYVEEIALEKSDILKVVKVNIDEAPEIAIKYKVLSIPTFILIKNKEIVKRETGAKDREALLALIEM